MTEPYFDWTEYENYGLALCVIYEGQKVYLGQANCSPKDEDMKSEKVGCEIALKRARIDYFKGQKEKSRIQLEGLYHLKSTLSPNINTADYIYKRLLKEIKNLENKIAYYNDKIKIEKTNLQQYIKDKDDFYNYIRKKRQAKTD